MKKIFLTIALLLALTSNASAQGRALGARMFTLDNGPGNTLTFVYLGDGGDTLDFPGAFLPEGSNSQTLRHNGSDWISDSNLLNDGSIVRVAGGVNHNTAIVMSDTTLGDHDYNVLVNSQFSSVTVTLPAATEGRRLTIKNLTACKGGFGVTLAPDGADVIEGESSMFLDDPIKSVTIVAHDSEWRIISWILEYCEGQGD